MREIQASDADASLPGWFDEVERGETVVIMRDGKPIARIVPESVRAYTPSARLCELSAEIVPLLASVNAPAPAS